MSDVKIRNLEPYVLSKLTEEAKKKKISREEYMRIRKYVFERIRC